MRAAQPQRLQRHQPAPAPASPLSARRCPGPLAQTYPLLNSFEGKGEWAVVPEGFGQTLRPLSAGLDVRLGDAGGRGCRGVQLPAAGWAGAQ